MLIHEILLERDAAPATGAIYAHVSPGKNLKAILAKGLVPNADQGNYAGYWEALQGVYVTRVPAILLDHIRARHMEEHFVIVLVEVGGPADLDEDVLHDVLRKALVSVLRQHRIAEEDADQIDPEDPIWTEVVAAYTKALGPSRPEVLARHPDLMSDFVSGWVHEHVYGDGDGDPMFFADAKQTLLQAFPKVAHPRHGERYSLRLDGVVGYSGPTRIVAVIDVQHSHPHLAKGQVPGEAKNFVNDIVS